MFILLSVWRSRGIRAGILHAVRRYSVEAGKAPPASGRLQLTVLYTVDVLVMPASGF